MSSVMDLSPKDLAIRFESLGDNCEFGLVQRLLGAEPLGLFRFSGPDLGPLRTGLRTGFEGLSEDVALFEFHKELFTLSQPYGFNFHTFRHVDDPASAGLLERERARLNFLRRRLLEDLASAEKIFVRKSNRPPREADVDGLFEDLRAHGPNTLLWVTRADCDHPPGTLDVARPGLLRGYLYHLAPHEHAHRLDLPGWRAMLRLACAAREAPGGHWWRPLPTSVPA